MLQIGAASLLQTGANVVTNWGSYYKLGQTLLQNRVAITNSSKIYYKLWHNSIECKKLDICFKLDRKVQSIPTIIHVIFIK